MSDPFTPRVITGAGSPFDPGRLRSPGGYMPMPDEGDRWDSRWGGPTPWDQNLLRWAQGAETVPQRPFEGMGKTNITENIPIAAEAPLPKTGEVAPQPLPPPQPGLARTIFSLPGGIIDAAAGGVPIVGDVGRFVRDVGGLFGDVLDFPLSLIRPLSFLPAGGDIKSTYENLEEDELKDQYDRFIAADPTHAEAFMAQYLEQRVPEVARTLGQDPLITGTIDMPATTLASQMQRLIFGGMTLPGNFVAREYVKTGRNIDASIINADPATLDEGLRYLRERYLSGAIDRSEFESELALSPFRWTNDTSNEARLLSFGMDIFSDPLTWATFGFGTGAAVGRGAVRTAAARVAQSAQRAGVLEQGIGAVARGLNITADAARALPDINLRLADWAKAESPGVFGDAMSTLSRRERALYELEPILTPIGRAADLIDDPMRWYGIGPLMRRGMGNLRMNHVRGWANAYGYRPILRVQGLFDDKSLFTRLAAVSATNQHASLMQRSIDKEVLGNNDTFREPGMSYQDAVLARMSIEDAQISEAESHALRNQESFLPAGVSGAEAADARMAQARESQAVKLSEMTGKNVDDMRRVTAGADVKTLALIHDLYYAYSGRRMLTLRDEAVRAIDAELNVARSAGDATRVAELEAKRALAERVTIVSERLLTNEAATTLLARMKAASEADAATIAREAIDQYDLLDSNYAHTRPAADKDLVDSMTAHLEYLLEKTGEDRLVRTLTDAEVADIHGPLAATFNGSTPYRVGLSPMDTWGISRDASGKATGVNSFVDFMDDGNHEQAIRRPFKTYDAIRDQLFAPIRGERIYFQARAKFINLGVREYGMTKGVAKDLFESIRKVSMTQRRGFRSFTGEDLALIASESKTVIDPDVYARIGERGLLELTARAFVGEIGSVGLTTRATDAMKRGSLNMRSDNLVGRTAEHLYPLLRYALSPSFLAMEFVEGPFFAILRGIKPGWRWSADDIRLMSILDFAKTNERYTDQYERALIAYGEGRVALNIAGGNGWFGRNVARVLPPRLRGRVERKQYVKGPRADGLRAYKYLIYVRQAGRDAAKRMRDGYMRYAPEVWNRWERELGTSDTTKVFMAMMEDRGLYNPHARHAIHMMDAAKPVNLGRREPIRIGDVTTFQGFSSRAAMKEALTLPPSDPRHVTRASFVSRYEDLGLSTEYAERAYTQAVGWTTKEWDDALAGEMGEGWKGAPDFFRFLARRSKMPYEEFMNEQFGDLPTIVDRASAIPTSAFRQSVLDYMAASGMTVLKVGSRAYERIANRYRELIPKYPDGNSMDTKVSTLEQRNVVRAENDIPSVIDANGNPITKFTIAKPGGTEVVDFTDGAAVQPLQGQALRADILGVFGSEKEALVASRWYDDFFIMWRGIVDRLPAEVVDSIYASAKTKGVGTVLADAKEEVAARLAIAFAVTQQNESVLTGMRVLMDYADSILRSVDPSDVKAPIPSRMEDILLHGKDVDVFSIGKKLADFIDSFVKANRGKRSYAGTLAPGAVDIWMKRFYGWGDSEYLDILARNSLRAAGTPFSEVNAKRLYQHLQEGVALEAEEMAFINERRVIAGQRDWQYVLDHEAVADPKKAGVMQRLGAGAADERQNVYVLRRMQALADEWNQPEVAFLGRTDWTVTDVQATLWVYLMKDIDAVAAPASSIMVQQGYQTVTPTMDLDRINDVWADRYPSTQEMQAHHPKDWQKRLDAIDYDVTRQLLKAIASQSGVMVTRVIDSVTMDAGGRRAASTVVITGHKVVAKRHAALLHLAKQSDGPIYVTGFTDAAKAAGSQGKWWGANFHFDPDAKQAEVRPWTKFLIEAIDRQYQKQGLHVDSPDSQVVLDLSGGLAVTRLWQGKGAASADLARFEQNVPLDPAFLASLADGTWLAEFLPSIPAERAKVTVSRQVMDRSEVDPKQIDTNKDTTKRKDVELGLGPDGRPVVDWLRDTARDAYDAAFSRHAGDAFSYRVNTNTVRLGRGQDGGAVYYTQRAGGRRGAIRAAFSGSGAGDYRVWGVRGRTDATSVIHEGFHFFARTLDPSAKQSLIDEYNASPAGRRNPASTFDNDVEEWTAYQFERYAAGDIPASASYSHTFKSFAEWHRKREEGGAAPLPKGVAADVERIFSAALERDRDTPGAVWNVDEQRAWEAARLALLRGEDQAHTTNYWKRGRNVIERSINHPYLGIYPSSYMWGKVLPELVRFLAVKPFGLTAPMGGALLANHVMRNVQWQIETDEDLRTFLDEHEETVRFFHMFLPGTPWELPVNLPVVARRYSENDAENRLRVMRGEKPEPFDFGGAVQDTLSYAFGGQMLAGNGAEMLGEWFGPQEETSQQYIYGQ